MYHYCEWSCDLFQGYISNGNNMAINYLMMILWVGWVYVWNNAPTPLLRVEFFWGEGEKMRMRIGNFWVLFKYFICSKALEREKRLVAYKGFRFLLFLVVSNCFCLLYEKIFCFVFNKRKSLYILKWNYLWLQKYINEKCIFQHYKNIISTRNKGVGDFFCKYSSNTKKTSSIS